VRALDIAIAALALRAAPTRPLKPQRRLVPAIDDADAKTLLRAGLADQRAAMVVSLWPPPSRQCVVRPSFEELPAPAVFAATWTISWRLDAPPALPEPTEALARAA